MPPKKTPNKTGLMLSKICKSSTIWLKKTAFPLCPTHTGKRNANCKHEYIMKGFSLMSSHFFTKNTVYLCIGNFFPEFCSQIEEKNWRRGEGGISKYRKKSHKNISKNLVLSTQYPNENPKNSSLCAILCNYKSIVMFLVPTLFTKLQYITMLCTVLWTMDS